MPVRHVSLLGYSNASIQHDENVTDAYSKMKYYTNKDIQKFVYHYYNNHNDYNNYNSNCSNITLNSIISKVLRMTRNIKLLPPHQQQQNHKNYIRGEAPVNLTYNDILNYHKNINHNHYKNSSSSNHHNFQKYTWIMKPKFHRSRHGNQDRRNIAGGSVNDHYKLTDKMKKLFPKFIYTGLGKRFAIKVSVNN
ncbi:hypothetical protein HELRODRAFT_163712 [Helobdella robusta]|uniref:Uncharacterized protein n=1 Tax=Helobdella robusta TaxID=6412 RepID=T1EUE1_HELRO|nr:hypothetical protein HELRODRAFT_163712 [Helobdella robusta]ESN96623.1 hypothetical protein HELRODRAFT_163712 [Helobdella robusta]